MARIVTNTNRTNARNNGNAYPDREPAKFYLNVGYPAVDPETGEEHSISIGIALDALPEPKGNSFVMRAKRKLIRDLLEVASQVEEGTDEVLDHDFELRIRHAGQRSEEEDAAGIVTPKISLVPKRT